MATDLTFESWAEAPTLASSGAAGKKSILCVDLIANATVLYAEHAGMNRTSITMRELTTSNTASRYQCPNCGQLICLGNLSEGNARPLVEAFIQ